MKNPCPIPSCEGSPRDGELLCLRHWRMVPSKVKASLWTAWRAIRFTTGKSPLERQADIKEYRAIRDQVIKAVVDAESPVIAETENSRAAAQQPL